MSALKIVKIIFLTILLAAPIYAGNVYYVDSATGNDSYPGTQLLPWRTIQKAANSLKAGDTVVVNSGTYNERILITNSGSSGSLIIFTANTNGEVKCQGFTIRGNYIQVKGFTVTATQCTWSENGYGIWVEGNNCIIEDIYAYYSPRGGITLRPVSQYCIVQNNRCYRNGRQGLEIHGINHIIQNNEIWGSICFPGCAQGAIGVSFFGSGHTFRKNYIHDIRFDDPENTNYSPHIDGFHTWADASHAGGTNILFEQNYISLPVYKDAAANGHGWMLEDCSYITIRNNIVITHGSTNTGKGTAHHVKIENNTFVGSLSFIPSLFPVGISLQNCPYSTVKNNIVYDQADWAIYLA